jgi:transcriptional regulator with GAF, ATPase, and Fis domain
VTQKLNFLERAVASPGWRIHGSNQERRSIGDSYARRSRRDYILDVLRRTDWVVDGRTGAAAPLGVPRTTLLCKMRKLGIDQKRVAFCNA